MFKVVRALIALSALFVTTQTFVVASPFLKRGDNTCPYSPYPYSYSSRSIIPRQNGNGLSFSGSQWIWTNEVSNGNAPPGTRAFRKTFNPPGGKTPSTLKVAFAVDNSATLFVNGQEIATEGDWFSAGTYCVPLKPYTNVIAFSATNAATVPNPAALLVTAEVTYTDGSTSHIASDSSWRTSGPTIPNGWEQLSFDDSSWATAVSEGAYPNALYGTIPIAGSDALSLSAAKWIWTSELQTPGGAVPVGPRALRRTVNLPPGHTSASAQILIVADNEYSLYVNGRFIGTGTSFRSAQRFTIDNIQGPKVVIAVYGVNVDGPGPNPAGLLAAMQITSNNPSYYCLPDCSSETYVITDSQWKAINQVPNGFEQAGFDDSAWPAAVMEGTIDSSPWAPITVATSDSAPGTPLPGAPTGN